MIDRLKRVFLGDQQTDGGAGTERERLELATCVLLTEAARVDDDFSLEERQHILNVMKNRFALSDADAEALLAEAIEVREESTDLFRFTTELNAHLSTAEKMQVLEEIWRLFYSDGTLDGHEDHLAHKLRNLLNLNHPQMIETKMRVLTEIRGPRN